MKTIEKTDSKKPIFYIGDHHGDWDRLLLLARRIGLENCYLISVGDSGVGFTPKERQLKDLNNLNEKFKNLGIIFMSIRGNHDDPDYYRGHGRIKLSNFQLIEDYTIMQHDDKLIQFIGGATSIDRTMRKEGVSYWSEEVLNFNRDKLQKVDALVTHTAPSWCFPQQFNSMVYGWAREDADLIGDLSDERAIMDEIYKICEPKLHLYGHFHDSWSEEINGCRHRLLNINEIWTNS
jgi:hypothetical protein